MTSTQARFDRWALVFGLARQARIYQQARVASYAAGRAAAAVHRIEETSGMKALLTDGDPANLAEAEIMPGMMGHVIIDARYADDPEESIVFIMSRWRALKFAVALVLVALTACGGGAAVTVNAPKDYVLVGDGPVVVMLTSITSMDNAVVDNPNTTTIPSRLLSAGYSLMSIDVPCQGTNNPTNDTSGDSLACWAKRIAAGDKDIFLEFCSKLSSALDDIGRPVAGIVGISRVGYVAAVCGAQDYRLKNLMLLAPVTDLNFLYEFAPPLNAPEEFSLVPLYPQLREKNVLVRIGETDTRVGTALAVDFAHDIGATLQMLTCPGHCSPEDGRTITWLEAH